MITTKSEHVSRILSNVNQAAVSALVDRLADTAVENDRLRAENDSLKAQISEIRAPQTQPIPA